MSNLPFISKVLERIVFDQLTSHIMHNNLHNAHQSAYRKNCSTESALLRVQNDLCGAVDGSGAALLVLLDLSTAFDTLDHSILLRRLEFDFGICENVSSWVKSYLSNRYQSIQVLDVFAEKSELCFGVPQGSVLGPFFI